MATKGPLAAVDSSDSDDSMNGERPDLSAEERSLPNDLLMNSNEFIRLFKKHQPQLQQIIKNLEKSSDEFLNKYEKATKLSSGGTIATAGAGAGLGVCLLAAPFTGGLSLIGAAISGVAAVSAGAVNVIGNINKKREEKKVSEDLKQALEKFKTKTKEGTTYLKNVCNQVEKILQYQNDEQPLLVKSGIRDVRKHADDLSELAKLFKPEDLQRLLLQGTRTLDWTGNTTSLIRGLLYICDFDTFFEDAKTLRDFEKLRRRRSGVQESELKSKAGQFILKMRETINHFQNTLNEMGTSKTEIENMIVPKLEEYCRERKQTD